MMTHWTQGSTGDQEFSLSKKSGEEKETKCASTYRREVLGRDSARGWFSNRGPQWLTVTLRTEFLAFLKRRTDSRIVSV
jgi:hypothetical protein